MIIMKGSTRVLDKPLVEQTGSTSSSKLLSIYGVTSYTEIVNIPFEVLNTTNSSTTININVNSLGNKALKYNGSSTLPVNAINSDSIYRIMYNGTDFTLLDNITDLSLLSAVTIPSAVLNLTSSSTSSDITTAFGGSTALESFMESLDSLNASYIVGINPTDILPIIETKVELTTVSNTDMEYDTIRVILPATKMLRTMTFTREANADTYDSVAVTEESLGGSSITVENSLVSDSTTNPPSVHAVNEALGQIDTILSNILN